MLLDFIELRNYSTFKHAKFDLRVDGERPLVLFTGNNGAGKTSTLDAFRLALHGRRSFLNGITDQNYDTFVRGRFRNGNISEPCAIRLKFQYQEINESHDVELERSWSLKRSRLSETFVVKLDGVPLTGDNAEELIVQVLPPEILGFFFFDGEKIGELADWEHEDDYKLFSSVNELLGLRLVDQLMQDLERVVISDQKTSSSVDLSALADALQELESSRSCVLLGLRTAKTHFGVCNRKLERARQKVSAMGGQFADKRKADERERDTAKTACDAAVESLRQDAGAYLPLLIAPNALRKLQVGIDVSEQLESLNAVDRAFSGAEASLRKRLADAQLTERSSELISLFREAIVPKPVAVGAETLDLTLSEASWMRSIVVGELPRLQRRIVDLISTYDTNSQVFQKLAAKLESAPKDDPDVELALNELQTCQREFFEAEGEVERLRLALAGLDHQIADATERARKARHEHFRNRRLANREEFLARLLSALPDYATSSKIAKERQFARLLHESLGDLWHKANRVEDVEVDLKRRTIKLMGAKGELSKNDLSAAEKQLFAMAFIFALAKLSGRHLPFVIDTPLGRLDRAHRDNLITDFLPNASHQVILFSTDTEIVGSLYKKAQPLIQNHYELAAYNDGATMPVQLEVAL